MSQLAIQHSSTYKSSIASTQDRLHETDLGHRIVSFVPHKDRRALNLVSKAWAKITREFPQNLVDILQRTIFDVRPDIFLLKNPDFDVDIERTGKIDPHFVEFIARALKEIAATPTGEKLLCKLTGMTHPIYIVPGNQNRHIPDENYAYVIFSSEECEAQTLILENTAGELYLSSLSKASTLAHELIHAMHHMEQRNLVHIKIKEDAHFKNSEEMLTILGTAPIDIDKWVFDEINENAILKELHQDLRISHKAYVCTSLENASYYGIDGEFRKWIEKSSSFNKEEGEKYLKIAVSTALWCTVRIQNEIWKIRRGNHLKIIELLLKAGCDKQQGFTILQSEAWYPGTSFPCDRITRVAKQLSLFPLHDAIRYHWKKKEIHHLTDAFLETDGISGLIFLLQTKEEGGATPLQIAKKMLDEQQKYWESCDTYVNPSDLDETNEFLTDKEGLIQKKTAPYKEVVDYLTDLEKRALIAYLTGL